MDTIFWSLAGFLSGSIPFSLIIGRLGRDVDIRQYGDHNPGATNVLRAAGWRWGIPAMLLDYFKGVVPVGLAWFFGDQVGWRIVPIALAPVLGHAFSPWLGLRGGKAVAATFGVWTGLTLGAGPMMFGILLGLMYAVMVVSGWAVILAYLCFAIFLATFYRGNPEFLVIWLGIFLVLCWKHRHDLRQCPAIRPGILRLVRLKR